MDQQFEVPYAIVATLVGLALATAFIVLGEPRPPVRLTEFYMIGPGGLAAAYPKQISRGQEFQIEIGITNRQVELARYRVEVRSDNRLLALLGPIEVEPGASWTESLELNLPISGDLGRVDFFLFSGNAQIPFRELHLWPTREE